ncbi:MAG: phosphatase PAP2 family protein, partial [Actinobacteria bacterium]|nr:phosphatase PAP2 family protein [Actinomycetota bacterium]
AASSWAGYTGLAVLAALAPRNGFDVAVRDLARPGDDWGPAQQRWDVLQNALQPVVVLGVLVAATAWAVVRRRSLRPALTTAVAAVCGVAVVSASKVLVARPDAFSAPGVPSSSFPSGHTFTAVAFLGLALLVLRPRAPALAWAVVLLLGAGMGISLLVQGVHWATDVLASILLGVACLATVVATGAADGPATGAAPGQPKVLPGSWR